MGEKRYQDSKYKKRGPGPRARTYVMRGLMVADMSHFMYSTVELLHTVYTRST